MASEVGTTTKPMSPLLGLRNPGDGLENLRFTLMVYTPYKLDTYQNANAGATSFRGFIQDIISLDVDMPRVGVPTLSFEVPGRYSPLLMEEVEIALCVVGVGNVLTSPSVHLSGGTQVDAVEVPNGRFYLRRVDLPYTLDGSASIKCQCTGILSRLQEAAIWHQTTEMYPDAQSQGRLLTRYSYPGPVFQKAVDACRAVSELPDVNHRWGQDLTTTWGTNTDSGSTTWSTYPWPSTENTAFQRTQTLYDIYEWVAMMDFARFYFLNHHMYLYGMGQNWRNEYIVGPTVLDGQAFFRYDVCTGGTTSTSWANFRTSLKVLGGDGSEGYRFNVLMTDYATEIAQLRETTVESQQVTNQEQANRLGDMHKLKYGQPEREVVRTWDLNVPGTPVPWVNYTVGDFAMVELPKPPYDPYDASTVWHESEQLRVVNLSVHWDSGGCTGTTTFGTMIQDVIEKIVKDQSASAVGKLPTNVSMRVS